MGEAGIFTPEDRVELLDGEIIQMTPIGSRHGGCVNRLNQLLIQNLAGRAVVTVQNPVLLDERSEPQPDVVVARLREDFYSGGHPEPGDMLLLIEVSDTTLLYDRNRKVPRYGARGVHEAWLVDLEAERIEVYREPAPDGYAQSTASTRGDSLSPAAFPDLTLTVDEILG